MLEIVSTSPPCGLNVSHQVENKRKSTSAGLVRQNQRLDTVVDIKLTNDLDYASISIKVIGHKLYDSSIGDFYMRCRMNFAVDPVQTHTPQFMDLGFSTINALAESSGPSTPDTRILRPTDVSHWNAQYHVFGESTAVGVSEAKSDHDYNYKTEFQIWKENKEFERQFFSMS